MDEPQPVWADRSARLTRADLPLPCDLDACATVVGFEDGKVVGGTVLADDLRDYVFCLVHADQVIHANPTARPATL